MYAKLRAVLDRALAQAESGKGKERHARGETPFDRQPICEIGRMVGIGYNLGQAMKKAQEASRMAEPERAVAELLGGINYLASAVMLIEESSPALVALSLSSGGVAERVSLLEVMQKEEREAQERQMSFDFGDSCPTCNEKGGFHHSQCAMNPERSKS